MQVQFSLFEIQPSVFLVTTGNRYDLGHLFMCAQEHYESAHEQWKGKFFERAPYERWYALNVSDNCVFSYPDDWSGFNVPSWAIQQFYGNSPYDYTGNYYDRMMINIDRTICQHLNGVQTYYLIGALQDDLETLDHEVAHGLYATSPVYKHDMDLLIARLAPATRTRVGKVLKQMGYDESVHDDEIQANFATGLTNYFKGFQRFCPPFIECFERHRTPHNFKPITLLRNV
jgi:hypothetical protein